MWVDMWTKRWLQIERQTRPFVRSHDSWQILRVVARESHVGGEYLKHLAKTASSIREPSYIRSMYPATICSGWVGISGDVLLGAVTEAAFQFIGVGLSCFCELKCEGVAKVVRSQRADVTFRVGLLGVVEPSDSCEYGVDAPT